MADKVDKGLVAGVDIGGTKIHAIIINGKAKIIGRGRKRTKAEAGFAEVMKRVGKCVAEACADAGIGLKDLQAVGVGAPSAIRPDGVAVNAPNLGWRNVPLVKKLREILRLPVFADNDCNMGTFGEYKYGAGRGAGTVAGFFVGTGLGGGLVMEGKVWRGRHRLATEFGHMVVVAGGRRCGCGHRGCLEAYASKIGMGHRFREEIIDRGRPSWLATAVEGGDYSNVRASLLAEGFRRGDAVVREILQEVARYLGIGVGNVINIVGPDVVVLGGGVCEALGKSIIAIVKAAAAEVIFPPAVVEETRIVLSELGDDAVALGAAAYAADEAAGGGH